MSASFILSPFKTTHFFSQNIKNSSNPSRISPRRPVNTPAVAFPQACAQPPTPQPSIVQSLYQILAIPATPDPKTLSVSQIRLAYLQQAKKSHPDTNPDELSPDFDQIAYAWSVLSDLALRKVYDMAGYPGLNAVKSIEQRADQIQNRFAHMSGDQLDYLSDTGELVGTLLTPASDAVDSAQLEGEVPPDAKDACPRSIDEALYNLEHHEDHSVVYYTLWWIYRFKVCQAEPTLVRVLRTSRATTSTGGFSLRRRAALALGAIAAPPTMDSSATLLALEDALHTDDYFLRYRAAEAVANIAYRVADLHMKGDVDLRSVVFPPTLTSTLLRMLQHGRDSMREREQSKSGFSNQESLFNLDAMEPDVREKLEAVFQQRRENEDRRRRTTMTPQLGVDRVGTEEDDEPYEWIIKAVSAIASLSTMQNPSTSSPEPDDPISQAQRADMLETINAFTSSGVPLVRYAAQKALFSLTGKEEHADDLIRALSYGVEHHYSQRVLIRDLGDLGFWQGAKAVAQCPMVENSFKILALKNMLAKLAYDAKRSEVQQVLQHMDSLL